MNFLKRLFYRLSSALRPDLREDYRLVRRLQKAVLPVLSSYHFSDYRILTGKREIPVRLFNPEGRESEGVLLFFHGGGWVIGDIDSYTGVCAHMASETNHTVVSVDYRLAPEHPFPHGLSDCYLVWRVLSEHPELLSCPVEKVTLIGDSAGGNLAAAVSLLAARRKRIIPKRQILLYPATNNRHDEKVPFRSLRENAYGYGMTTKAIQEYRSLYLTKKEDRDNPLASPLLAVDVSDQPRTLVITAAFDPLRDEGTAYAAKLAFAGVKTRHVCLPNAAHGFISEPKFSQDVVECYRIINQFLGEDSCVTQESRFVKES